MDTSRMSKKSLREELKKYKIKYTGINNESELRNMVEKARLKRPKKPTGPTGESYEEVANKIFYRCDIRYRGKQQKYQNIWPYLGKHYMEEWGSHYLHQDEFRALMKRMGYKTFPKCDRYNIRVKEEYLLPGFY